MKSLRGTIVVLFATTAMTSGCSTVSQPDPGMNTNATQEVVLPTAVDTSYPGLKRIIASEYLIGDISIVNPKISQVGSFSKAQVTVQNLTQNRYELEYQYQWEDQGGFAVGTPRPWKRFVLGPKEATNFSEMALHQDASQTIFTVRVVDDTFIELNKQLGKNN